jgi:hypothetical protein
MGPVIGTLTRDGDLRDETILGQRRCNPGNADSIVRNWIDAPKSLLTRTSAIRRCCGQSFQTRADPTASFLI